MVAPATVPHSPPRDYLSEPACRRLVVSRPEEVTAYLERHPDLVDLIPALCARAEQEFGAPVELALEVYRDPEIDDPHLVLYVRLPSYDDTSVARIDKIWAPFEDSLAASSGYLLVTTDFRSPLDDNGI